MGRHREPDECAIVGREGHTTPKDGGPEAFLPIGAAVPGTTYTDAEVSAGYAYNYVIAATVGACTSPLTTPAVATAAP